MTDDAARHLSDEEMVALKFAARRQLARWSNKPQLSPNQQTQRNALARAVRVLQDDALSGGCELHSCTNEQHADA